MDNMFATAATNINNVHTQFPRARQHAAGYNNQPNVADDDDDDDDDDDEYNHLIVIYQNQNEGIFCQPCSLINTMRWQLSRGEERTKRKVIK